MADAYSGLQVIDISDPTTPTLAGSYDTPAYARCVAISGEYAYVADDWSGMHVINISHPTTPTLSGSYDTPGNARCVAISGDYAYVADWGSGLQVIDISDSTAPSFAGSFNPPGDDFGVAISGDYAYVACQASGLQVLDISDPTAPSFVDGCDTPGDAYSVVVSGDYAYVGDYGSGFQVIKIAGPLPSPILAGSYVANIPVGYAIDLDGDYAYIGDVYATGALRVIDISDPTNPLQAGLGDIAVRCNDVDISGNYAYVAGDESGLGSVSNFRVFDISSPTNPLLVGGLDTPGFARAVAISGYYAYVADGDSGLNVLDISMPTSPTGAGVLGLAGQGVTMSSYDVAISGDYAFVADGDFGLKVIYIGSPPILSLVGSYDTPGSANGIAIAGDYAYIADWDFGLQVIDITTLSAPTLAGSYDTPGVAHRVEIVGDFAYIANEYALIVIDISDPTAPTLAGEKITGAGAFDVAVAGDYAYVAEVAPTMDDYPALEIFQVLDRTFNHVDTRAQSLTLNSLPVVVGSVRLSTLQTDSIIWEMSPNGGADWEEVVPGGGWHSFAATGNDLRWRSAHVYNEVGVNPSCDTLRIELQYGDSDDDGVPDLVDACPDEDASFFDRDGDGCIDDPIGARHIEYWATDDLPVSYVIHDDGAPGITDGSDFTAIQNAMNTWAGVSRADFTVSYAGTTPVNDAQALDFVNLVTFNDPDYVFAPTVISVGLTTSFIEPTILYGALYRPGQIVDADVLFNPMLSYETPMQGSGYDIQAAMTHSAGHIAAIANSAIQSSTMSIVFSPEWSSLEPDDELTLIKAYPTSSALATASRLGGTVYEPNGSTPIPGAAVFAIDAGTGDTLICEYTMLDGTYLFFDLPPGDYYVSTHPLDGSSAIGYMTPSNVNTMVDTSAQTVFLPEFWSVSETNSDDPTLKDAINLPTAGDITGIDIITNEDLLPPEVISVTPYDGETEVPPGTAILVAFSDQMDPTTITGNFIVEDTLTHTIVSGSAVLLNDDSLLVFVPSSALAYQTVYKTTVDVGLQDRFGNGLSEAFISHFTTQMLPDDDIDGVPNVADACIAESAWLFDRDGDGCIDKAIGARHIEYWAEDDTLRYHIQEEGAPYITDPSDTIAIHDAMNMWPSIPGTDIEVRYAGTTTQDTARILDQVNLITFTDDEYDFGTYVLAVGVATSFTTPTLYNGKVYRPGQIVDVDMIFNPQRRFKTTPIGEGRDLFSTALHEAGHLFGLSHSALKSASMFFVLQPGTAGGILSPEDETVFLKAYADSLTLADASHISGRVLDGASPDLLDPEPIPGAIIFAINIDGDTVGCDFTLPDGSYHFLGLPANDYYLSIYPVNGTSPIGYLIAPFVNWLVDSLAVTNFVPEYYNIGDGPYDDPADKSIVGVADGVEITDLDFITNIDTTGPAIAETKPLDAEVDVEIDASVAISFSEPINHLTVQGNFRLLKNGTDGVGGNAYILKDDSLLVFTPWDLLDYSATYVCSLKTGLEDYFGNTLPAPYVFSFTTQPEPPLYITDFLPNKGVVGSIVVINGGGFDTTAAANTIRFKDENGTGIVATTPTSATQHQLVVTVPQGAGTGNVYVMSGPETSDSLLFTVLPSTEVSRSFQVGITNLGAIPRSLTVLSDGSYAYVATQAGASAVDVDPGSGTFRAHTPIPIPGGLDELDATPDGKWVYGVSRSEEALHVIDPVTKSVVTSIGMTAEPLGILIDQSGRQAFVPTSNGEIQIWDVKEGSGTFREQIGTMASPEVSIRGKMALDPSHNRLLALSGSGKLLFFDLSRDSFEVDVDIGLDPRDVVIDPTGKRAYVSDGMGLATVVSLDGAGGPFKVRDITTGGSLRGLTITPAGVYVLAANRQLDLLDVIDLNADNPTFWGVSATIPQATDPVDVDLSPEGLYAFSLVEEDMELVITAIGVGPAIRSLSRRAGPIGTKLVLGGEGFGTDLDSLEVKFVDASGAIVGVAPERSTGTALTVTVPASAASGAVSVTRDRGTWVENSNEIHFEVLGPTPAPGQLRLAEQTEPAPLLSFEASAALSPAGDQFLMGTNGGDILFVDTDPNRPTFNQPFNEISFSSDVVSDIAITPDGKRAYAVVPADENVYIINCDRTSNAHGTLIGTVDLGTLVIPDTPRELAISPDGETCVVQDIGSNMLYFVDIMPGSPTENTVVDTASVLTANEMAFHPSGEYLYLASGPLYSILIVDMNPASEAYRTLIPPFPIPLPAGSLPDPPDRMAPFSLSFHPDGSRCLVLVFDQAYLYNFVYLLDTSTPHTPTWVVEEFFAGWPTPLTGNRIDVSPRGDRAVFHMNGVGIFNLALTPFAIGTVNTFYSDVQDDPMDQDFSHDGSRIYVGATLGDSLLVYDFSDADTLAMISGNGQTGVIDQTLPAPLRVRAFAGGAASGGVPVTFEVTSGGGVFEDTDTTIQIVSTDANGYAEVDWTLGSVTGSQAVQARALGLVGSPIGFSATGEVDPGTLPLEFVDVYPLNGALDVSVTTTILATFSRGVDTSSVNTSSLYLHKNGYPNPIPVTFGFTDEFRKVSLTPMISLETDTIYTVEFTNSILDSDGWPLQNPTSSSFSTESPLPLSLASVSPPSATVGVTVVLGGTGFDPDPGQNTVLFNERAATPSDGGINYLSAAVPEDAVSGTIRVAVGTDTSNALPFNVLVPTSTVTDEVVATVGTGTATKSITINPDGTMAYAISPEGNVVVPIDVDNETSLNGIPVGDHPISIDMHPEGNFIYVANYNSSSVSIIGTDPNDLTTYHQLDTTLIVGNFPLDLVASPLGDRVYVVNASSDFTKNLDVIDSDDASSNYHKVVATLGSGDASRSITINPDGSRLYVGTNNSYIVLRADDYSYSVVATIGTSAAAKSLTINPDGTLLFILTTEGSVIVYYIEPGSGNLENKVVASLGGAGESYKSLTINPDGTLLYLVQEESNLVVVVSIEILGSVSAIDPEIPAPPVQVQLTIVDSIQVGEGPEAIAFDPSGSGLALITNAGDSTVTFLNATGPSLEPLAADILVTPRTLNLRSRGRWVTGSIELPPPFYAEDIDISTVLLQDTIPADPDEWEIVDSDQDGIRELVVMFDRALFQAVLPQGEYVPVTISGEEKTRDFIGEDTIRTIRPTVKFPKGGEILPIGETITVTWASPVGYQVDSADVYWTHDDGSAWYAIASGIPDAGSVAWQTPDMHFDSCRVMVTLYKDGTDLGMGMSQDMFVISSTVSVTLASFDGVIKKGTAILRWRTTAESNIEGFNILRAENQEDGSYTQITKEAIPSKGEPDGASYEFEDDAVRPNRTYYYMLEEATENGPGKTFGPYKVVYAATFDLEQNFPNPFNPNTTIGFTIPVNSHVKLVVYDVAGRRVRTLVNGLKKANRYEVEWDGKDNRGVSVSSGVYFYRIEAGKFKKTRKMVLIK